MAQNITLLGASYPDVPAVTLPKTGGGTAVFTDTSAVSSGQQAAAAAQILSGYSAWVNGVEVKGSLDPGGSYYPVGSLWATDDPDETPGTVLGIGTWSLVRSVDPSWNELSETETTWDEISDSSTWDDLSYDLPYYFIWKRTA